MFKSMSTNPDSKAGKASSTMGLEQKATHFTIGEDTLKGI